MGPPAGQSVRCGQSVRYWGVVVVKGKRPPRSKIEREVALKAKRLAQVAELVAECQAAAAALEVVECHLHNVVRLARTSGATWSEVGAASSVEGEAARKRFERRGPGVVHSSTFGGRQVKRAGRVTPPGEVHRFDRELVVSSVVGSEWVDHSAASPGCEGGLVWPHVEDGCLVVDCAVCEFPLSLPHLVLGGPDRNVTAVQFQDLLAALESAL